MLLMKEIMRGCSSNMLGYGKIVTGVFYKWGFSKLLHHMVGGN
jgi:hypothetical protein